MPILAAVIFGAIVGSFLNVCIFRIPLKRSIVYPGSHCFSCHKPIAWYDNVPLLSFFILKGRCRHCHVRLSWQYPIVEYLSALLFVVFYLSFGLSVKGVITLGFSLALLVQGAVDFKRQIIPDVITLPGILLGLLLSALIPALQRQSSWEWGFLYSFCGVLLGGGILYSIGTAAGFFLKKEAMGGGDVKLLAMIGAFLGWQGVTWTLFLASLVGSVAGVYMRAKHHRERIPFGPYLALAAVLYLFFGERFFDWYRYLLGY